jgi:phosphoribosylformylglycinamidine synthase
MEFEVLVRLKDEVLDPEGRAIKETFERQGITGVSGVEVSKRYLITIDKSANEASAMIENIAAAYLANPVSQSFEIRSVKP